MKVETILSDPAFRLPSRSIVSVAFIMKRSDLTLRLLNIIYNFEVRLKHERSCFSNCCDDLHRQLILYNGELNLPASEQFSSIFSDTCSWELNAYV